MLSMSMSAVFLVAASFLASSVEMVEALTIVLAVGVTREWRSTLIGVASALVALAVIVAVLGPALALIPIDGLRLVIGALLLVFGLQWLRKSILRASGFKALHDEDAIYARELNEARTAGIEMRAGMDWYAYTLSFKGVFLEGLEVIFIVLTFGATQGSIALAALGAAAAVLLVGTIGVLVHQPLSRVPENAMKFVVGTLLTSFGAFWGGEGVGIVWPGEDLAILGLLVFVLVVALLMVALLVRIRSMQMTMPSRAVGASR